ncbi:MAG: hypothetical protein HYY50_03585 [Candidatus Kerfeldbacteria bacterium]|nr:hypothetical protein [Candidatus Kerfeldbacteria bacterium]
MHQPQEWFYIKKVGEGPSGLDRYIYEKIYPFIGNIIVQSNTCELLVDEILKRIGLAPRRKITMLGKKVELLERNKEKLPPDIPIDAIVVGLRKVNGYFRIAKHAIIAPPGEMSLNENVSDATPVQFIDLVDQRLHTFSKKDVTAITTNFQETTQSLEEALSKIESARPPMPQPPLTPVGDQSA